MKEQLTEEQKKFLTAEGKVVVKACPGSGKTYSVAHKLLSYIDNWKDYHSGVAVLSFTNVASNEIQEKAQTIHGSLGELGYPHFIGTVIVLLMSLLCYGMDILIQLAMYVQGSQLLIHGKCHMAFGEKSAIVKAA